MNIGGGRFLLGRVSNNPTSGIVGLANVGKSTFFQAITNSKLGNPANYPFATIDPECAKVNIPSTPLSDLLRIYQSAKIVPGTLTIYDIAGLTRGASQGHGLGNKFLNDIRHVDGIFQVVRGFLKEDITHIEGNVDPVRDLSVVQDELILKDLEFLENIRERLSKKMRMVSKNSKEYQEMKVETELLDALEEHLFNGKKIRHFKDHWNLDEVKILNKHNFLTSKPTLILLNVSPQDYLRKENKFVKDILKWVNEFSPGDKLVLFSAEFESQLIECKDTLSEYFDKIRQDTSISDEQLVSAIPRIILEMRNLLNLISFFTCGPQEVHQWNIREGTTAQEAAGVIHSDLRDTFINADVIKYDDLKTMEPPLNESLLKSKGLVKRAGKQYIMQDNDVAFFKAAGGKTR
ncbi:Ylf2p [Saccharomyces eubayanus]|uniref:Ylf2p n=1 Tax=Saccharomyces eubayanus TaxID=1080349 RepID=UPI0006BF1842|nr:YLF2-like protein [Saccharomyces eubayanus]KOG96505.1 YLF2-like protein [Saccharomyces eubayanus]